VEAEVAGRRVFTATLGSTARITLKRRTTAERGGHQTEQPPLAIVRTRVYASPSLERVEAALDYRFSGESRDSFTLQMDAGLTPVSFAVPGLESWVLREEGGRQVLELRLERAVQDDFRLSMVAERMVGALPLMEKAPLILAGAGRVELECSVLATDDLKVRPLENAAHQRVDFLKPSGAGDEGFDAIGSWKAAGTADPLRWELSASTPAASAVVRYAFQPGAGKVELSAGMELSPAPGRELRELTIQVPDGSTIQGVTSDRLTDWWHEGRLLHVRLSGGRDGATHVALNLTHPLAAAASAVVFQPLLIHGFDKVSGSGLLIAPVNQEAILQLSPAGPALREVAPQDTQSGFTIRHPFAGKRGFVFEGTAWSATVTLQPLVERYDVDWVMDAEVRDSWTVVNTRILLNLTRGGLERVVFTTPASAPELRATGNDIRETASVVEGALRRYTVSFQTLMTGAVLFTLTGQMPHGGSGLPDIGFPGAARMARFVIVDNKSSGNLTMEAAGLEVTPREQVSFLPAALAQGQSGAQFYAARPDWSLKLGVEKLETTAGHAALVLHAELTTSVLRNGEIWQRAVYVLQNRTLQFLPVRLPEPAVVVSVEVGGETTRADTGVVDGLPVLLIPLIQTAAGELATEVKLISRRRAQSGAFHGVLEDPDLPGLPIGQTFWTIQYPDGYQLEADGGNMTSTDESALSSDKALSWLTELAQLKNIAMSSQYDGMSRITARKNARTLFSKVQSALAPGQEADSAGLLRDLEEALIPAPQTATNLQKDATAEEGAELRAKEFVSNRAGIGPVQPQKQTASAGTGKDLNLNDNVTWNVKTGTDSVQKSQNSAGQPGNRRLSQIDKLGRGKVAGEKRVGDDKQHLGSAEPMANFASQNSAYSFQNGRLNDPGQRVLPDSAKSAQDLTAPAAPMARPSALGASTGSPRADDPLSSKPAQPALNGHLRTSGRSSLAAVFPEQPNALHFKKVKGDAFVKLQLHRPWHQQMDRSAAWALSVGLGALLVLRWLYFRARRQAERCS
jgi:hypothetical protein